MIFPLMRMTAEPVESRAIEFKGYDTQNVIEQGSMRDMRNLCSDEYPSLYPRPKRGIYADFYVHPSTMIARKEKLAVCDDTSFWYDGRRKFDFALQYDGKRKMQAINTRIVIFPDKMWYNTETGEYGDLGFTANPTRVSFHEDPTTKEVCCTFDMPVGGSLEGFKKNDTISFSGMSPEIKGFENGEDNNVRNIIIERIDYDNNKVYLAGGSINFPTADHQDFIDTGESGSGFTIEREIPDLDHILEYGNRLYGCKGNTIYVSKLGDPTNWWFFGTGTAESAYQVDVGTDGDFTGIAPFPTHILFFKENCVHKLYGYKPSNYQLISTNCLGVEKGSDKSIQLINGAVYYKSREGIMVYTGDTPTLISPNFGKTRYDSAVSGTDMLKYYVSMRNKTDGNWYMFVYDLERGLWFLEDNTCAEDFAFIDNQLVYTDRDKEKIISTSGNDEDDIEWYAKFGEYDEFIENKKVYSKILMRLKMEENTSFSVWISVDDGAWESVCHLSTHFPRAVEMPIVPRRCNRFAVLIKGTGYVKIESMTRVVREGTMR